jgi:hypothetical protein
MFEKPLSARLRAGGLTRRALTTALSMALTVTGLSGTAIDDAGHTSTASVDITVTN